MRIWQAGKKDESLHIVDPIATATGNALKIGNEVRCFKGAETTGIYTGVVTLMDGTKIPYEFDGLRY